MRAVVSHIPFGTRGSDVSEPKPSGRSGRCVALQRRVWDKKVEVDVEGDQTKPKVEEERKRRRAKKCKGEEGEMEVRLVRCWVTWKVKAEVGQL